MIEAVKLRQMVLGAHPYVLIQVIGGELDDSGEVDSVKLDVQFGGGLDQESMFELLAQIVHDQAQEDENASAGAWHSVWIHGRWRHLTGQMTSEERELAATAVERAWSSLGAEYDDITRAELRWWTCYRCRNAPWAEGYFVCERCIGEGRA